MTKQRIPLATILLLSTVVAVQAQTQTQYDKGTPPQHAVGVSSSGSYVSTELGTVSLSNGSLNFKVPIGTIGGRGMLLPLTLNYSSKVWSASLDTDTERESMTQQPVAYADYDRGLSEGGNLNTLIGAGWTIAGLPSIDAKRVLIGRITSGPNIGCYNFLLTKLTLYLPDRGEVDFRDDATDGAPLPTDCSGLTASRGTRWHAMDGSGAIFINDVDHGASQWPQPNLSGVVILADGTRIRFGENGSITDRNGNKITGYTDPLGRTVTVQHNVPDPENPGITLRVLVTVPGYGGPRYYKIKTGVMNQNYRSGINPTLPVISGDWDPEGWGHNWPGNPTRLFLKSYGFYAQRIDDIEVLTELILPDGRSLRFKYNTFGEVAEVLLPTGGKIEYDYGYSANLPTGNSPIWETGTNGSGSGIVSDVKFVDRTVRERRTYPDGVTLEGKWNYDYGGASASVSVRSSSDTLLSNAVHYFLPAQRYSEYPWNPGNHDGSHYTLWSTGVEWRTEIRDSSGAVIAATEEDWTQRAPVAWPTYQQEQPANDNRVNQTRKYLETGAMAKVESFYDQFNNPTEIKEYDFDQSLKRRTVTSFSSTNLVNGINYADNSIRLIRLPLQQSIYDGAGIEQARTLYEYDVYDADGSHDILLPYPSITGHDTVNYGASWTARGNITRIANWIKTTDSYVYSYPRYDIAGNVVSAKNPRGNVTTISFADDFGNGSNPGSGAQGANGPTYAFPTLITSPPPNPGASAHTARNQYDFSTGLLTGFKDRNGIITQTIYTDPFNRPTLVKSALGISGIETHAAMFYAPVTTPFGITLTNNDVMAAKDHATPGDAALRSWTMTDGFGRTIEGWSKDPQGDVKVATIFDALGRSTQVSNPYRPALSETPAYTTTEYDCAGRVTSVTTPGNASVRTAYSGNRTLVADQNTSDDVRRKRISETDALGRLRTVWEVTAADQYTEGVSFPNWPSVTNAYKTAYQYDALDNLKQVSQGGQTRTFVYDSLKRLTSATNPESGAVSYQYDNNGNLLVKTDARGVSSHYEYDALDRVSRRWYNGSTSLTDVTHNFPALPSGVGASDEAKYFYDSQSLPTGAPSPFDRGYSTGRLVATTYGGGSSGDYFGFDAAGRAKLKIQQTGGVNYQTTAIYDLGGAITSMSYPSGRTVTNTFDTAGRLSSFTGNLGDGTQRTYASGILYSSFGGKTKEQFGTTTPLFNKSFYNSRGQLAEIRVGTTYTAPSDTGWERGAIINHYSDQCWGMCGGTNSTTAMTDNNGNLKKQDVYIPDNDPMTSHTMRWQQYDYDSLNRLKWVRENSGSSELWKQEFVYDRWGNRTIHQTNTWGVGKPNFGVDQNTNRLTAPSGSTMSYDAAGNLIFDNSDGIGGTRTYDAENKMKQAWAHSQWQTYVYDGDGGRIKRIMYGVETWQVYGLGGELLADYAANGAPSNPQKEYGYRSGELLITAETSIDGGSQTVSWTNSVGVTVSGNNLTKTAATGWGNSGASSTQTLSSGNGYVEFTVTELNTYRLIGLSNGDSTQDWTDIDFGLMTNCEDPNNLKVRIFEAGTVRGDYGTFTTGDKLRVEIEGGVVKYQRNGTVLYTSTVAPTYPLLVDTALYSNNATIANAAVSANFSITQNVTWTSAAGVSVSGNSLTKTAATGWGNSGASSTQTLSSGNGYVEFTVTELNTYRLIGLSNGDSTQDWTDIDFGLMTNCEDPNNLKVRIFEAGTVRGDYGTFTTGDKLRVAIEGGVVKYQRNGTVLYTSTVAPTYPLLVDTALYSNGATLTNVVISSGGSGGNASAAVKWLVNDHLGTPRMIFDQTGSLANVSRHDYLPFGEELFGGPPSQPGVGGRTTTMGYTSGDNVRPKFTSKERDTETGLDYFLARYYSSTQGRFTSVDPISIGFDRLFDPQRLNRYAHVRNNPFRYVDQDGRDLVLANTTAQQQIRSNIDVALRAAERQNLRIVGNKVELVNPTAINVATASTGYQLLIGIIQSPATTRYFGLRQGEIATATNADPASGNTTTFTFNQIHATNGATIVYQNGDRDVFVPSATDMTVQGVSGDEIPFPEWRSWWHETVGHTTMESDAVEIENQIAVSIGQPLRSGGDHLGANAPMAFFTTTRAQPDPILVQPLPPLTNQPIMRPLKKPEND